MTTLAHKLNIRSMLSLKDWQISKKWGTIFGWIGTAGNSVGQLALPPVIISVLGDSSLALWQLVVSCFFLTLLADLGTTQGVIRILAEYCGTKDDRNAYRGAQRATWLVAGVYVLFFAVILGFNLASNKLTQQETRLFTTSLIIFGLWGAIRTRFQLRTQYLLASGDVGTNALIMAVVSLTRPLAAVVALYITESFYALPIAYIGAELASLALAYVRAPKLSQSSHVDDANKYTKRIFAFGIGNGISSLAGQAANYLQPIFITMTLGVTNVALYTCTLTSAIMLQRLMHPLLNVWYPTLVKWNKETNADFLPAKFKRLLIAGTGIALCAGVVTGLLNPLFVRLWVGDSLYAGHVFSWLVAVQVPLFFLGGATNMILRAYAHTAKPIAAIATVELALILILSIQCFSYWGLMGGLILLSGTRTLSIILTFSISYNVSLQRKHIATAINA